MQLNKHYFILSTMWSRFLLPGKKLEPCGLVASRVWPAQWRNHLPDLHCLFHSSILSSFVLLFLNSFSFPSSFSDVAFTFSCTSPASLQVMLRNNQPLRSKLIVERCLLRRLPYKTWTPTLFHIICTTLCQKAKDDIVGHSLECVSTTPSFSFPFFWLRHQSASFHV